MSSGNEYIQSLGNNIVMKKLKYGYDNTFDSFNDLLKHLPYYIEHKIISLSKVIKFNTFDECSFVVHLNSPREYTFYYMSNKMRKKFDIDGFISLPISSGSDEKLHKYLETKIKELNAPTN